MRKFTSLVCFLFLLLSVSLVWSYTNLTPAEVHARLAAGDTLLLLDVREISEYRAGHIAEPAGQLPLTPVNMPYSSNVLAAEYQRLPGNVDVLVYCHSGGRSASAASFLESKGFTRIFNMTGGFASWTYETRNIGFGDHSGQWVSRTATTPVTILCIENGDTSKIHVPPGALGGEDSMYVELHFASKSQPRPPDVPQSDLAGLFRITALDPYGLSRFSGDSLVLADTVTIQLFPKYSAGEPGFMAEKKMKIFVPGKDWKDVPFEFKFFSFNRKEFILRRWYNLEGFIDTGLENRIPPTQSEIVRAYPNPFNGSLRIVAPPNAQIAIYDVHGRLLERIQSPIWNPGITVASGVYFIQVKTGKQCLTKKVTFLK